MKRIAQIAAASLALMIAISATPASARKVSNDTAAHLLSVCMIDHGKITEPQGNGSYIKCCTKEGGYCIICRQDGKGLCNKTPYRAWQKDVTLPEAPASCVIAPKRSTDGRIDPGMKFGR